jgi:hypothetical protein
MLSGFRGPRALGGQGVRAASNGGNGHPKAAGNGHANGHANGNGYSAAPNGNGVKAAGDGNGHGQSVGGGNGNGNGGNGNGNGHGPGGGPEPHQAQGASAKEQVFEILHVVFKRWRLIAGLFAVVALSGLLAVLSRGPQYSAKGKVMITSDRADAVIQPTDADSLALLKLNESVVNSETHLIQSRELLEPVVRGLALAPAAS